MWQRKTGATDHELGQGRWKYKPLQGPKAKAVKLRQISIGQGLRAALIVEEGERCAMTALVAYGKGAQEAQIERAVELARHKLEEQP